jgi:hypothetical protein
MNCFPENISHRSNNLVKQSFFFLSIANLTPRNNLSNKGGFGLLLFFDFLRSIHYQSQRDFHFL